MVLSSTLFMELDVVVVGPLLRDRSPAVDRIDKAISVEGEPMMLALSLLFSVSPQSLRIQAGNIAAHQDDIRRGLDRLFSGF